MINLDDKKSKGIHWVSLFFDRNKLAYFGYFESEYIPQDVLNTMKDSIAHNIFRIQDNDMCWFYYIAFMEYMLAEKKLLDYTNLFSPNDYKKNGKIIY